MGDSDQETPLWMAVDFPGTTMEDQFIKLLRVTRNTLCMTAADRIECAEKRLNAAVSLLRGMRLVDRDSRIQWGYNSKREEQGYFLDGVYAGKTIEDVIRKAAGEEIEG